MTISHFLSAASHSSTDTAGVDFDWLPGSSIKQWNSELPDSWGDGSLTSPPQPQTIHPPTNNILFHHTFSLLNPSLKTNGLLQQTGSSPSPSLSSDNVLHKLSLPARDFQVRGLSSMYDSISTNEVLWCLRSASQAVRKIHEVSSHTVGSRWAIWFGLCNELKLTSTPKHSNIFLRRKKEQTFETR